MNIIRNTTIVYPRKEFGQFLDENHLALRVSVPGSHWANTSAWVSEIKDATYVGSTKCIHGIASTEEGSIESLCKLISGGRLIINRRKIAIPFLFYKHDPEVFPSGRCEYCGSKLNSPRCDSCGAPK